MGKYQAVECTECGEYSPTEHNGPFGPVCGRCHEWDLRVDDILSEKSLIMPGPVGPERILVAQT
jgi:endogenous inhibitor of DNA gyrase (YacG/DUF329 family)